MTAGERYKMIDEIDWSQYETAYGNAAQDIPHFQAGKTPSVPRSLWDLFSGDRERAIRATGDLWAGLCHQHAYISSAALPAYSQALFVNIGIPQGLAPTLANIVNLIMQVVISYPAMKFWIMPDQK